MSYIMLSKSVWLSTCVLLQLLPICLAQCNYAQQLKVGERVDVFSPNYGLNKPYPKGTICNWQATSPPGTHITVSCSDIRLPWSQGCNGDRLEISFSGNPTLADAQRYCTNTPFSFQTQSNAVRIRLTSIPRNIQGGFLRCELQVVGTPSAPTSQPSPGFTFFPGAEAQSAAAPTQCGRRKTSRIVGGYNTLVNEFPMMAGLVNSQQGLSVYCGATIINNYYAVSAAHCFSGKSVNGISLLVGEHDYNTGSDTPYAKLYYLQGITVHPGYTGGDTYDMATLRTQQPIAFNIAVGPVCLPYGTNTFEGQYVEAVGWGTRFFGGPISSVLQKVTLQVISNQQCAQYYGNRIINSHICTLMQGRDTCQRDSGGPLFIQQGGLLYLAGIISFGTTCADGKPGVSTRVTNFSDWIRANTR